MTSPTRDTTPPSQTLYTYPENWRAFKALIAAQYSGAKIKVLSSPPHFHFGQTNKTPEFLRKFPVGKVSLWGHTSCPPQKKPNPTPPHPPCVEAAGGCQGRLIPPQVPAFEGDDGFCVFESNAIAYYGELGGLRCGGGPVLPLNELFFPLNDLFFPLPQSVTMSCAEPPRKRRPRSSSG